MRPSGRVGNNGTVVVGRRENAAHIERPSHGVSLCVSLLYKLGELLEWQRWRIFILSLEPYCGGCGRVTQRRDRGGSFEQ